MRDKQIMIDGVKYNPCNDCELWNGHHCIGARSYEPNANEHKAICNEHMAKQFYKVYQQLYRKTQECEELKEENQQLRNNLSDSLMFKFTGQENETNRYRKALEEIEEYINNQGINHKWNMYIQRFRQKILDIINKAKGGV